MSFANLKRQSGNLDKLTKAVEALNPFDMWKGANFKLKIRKVEGYQNYDKSEFESASALLDDDDELEKIWKSQHSLQSLLDEKEFKSYDQLKNRLEKVLGLSGEAPAAPVKKTVAEEAPKPKAKVPEVSVHEDEDDMEYFARLAEED